MIVKELMERVPSTNEGYAIAYANDAVKEIAMMINDKIEYSKVALIKDQRLYDVPTAMLKLINIYILDNDSTPSKYVRIPRLLDHSTQDDD